MGNNWNKLVGSLLALMVIVLAGWNLPRWANVASMGAAGGVLLSMHYSAILVVVRRIHPTRFLRQIAEKVTVRQYGFAAGCSLGVLTMIAWLNVGGAMAGIALAMGVLGAICVGRIILSKRTIPDSSV